MSILTEIKKSSANTFRRLYMRRRVGNDYEATWTRIPQRFIQSFGQIEFSIEDIKVNFFKGSGLTFKVHNNEGYFSDVNEPQSFFYNASCIPMTMVKVEAGYIASDGTEYPTNPTMFIGLIDGDVDYSNNNLISFNAINLSDVFDKLNASAIPNMNGAYTASDIFTKIKNFQDTNTVYVFQKYISSGAWSITATTNRFDFSTNTTLEDITCWELMQKLAEAENKLMYISREGNFNFHDKAVAGVEAFHFSGLGDTDKTWGRNMLKDITLTKMNSKIYNRIRIKHDDADTTTSYYTYKENWAWGDSTSSWLYGVKTYEIENSFLDPTTSALIATEIYTEYVNPKDEVKFKSKFVPHLNLNDYVTATYKSKRIEGGALWGQFLYGHAVWGETKGYNVNIEDGDFRMIGLSHDLDKFISDIRIRQL